jgi:DivIVA domain-containing protein
MRKKTADDQEAPASPGARITPSDVQQVEFRLAFRGYNERDVDAFLDRITEDLSAYLEELERLRGGAPAPTSIATADDAGPEAAAIVARARQEAAAIVRRARDEAAAIRAGAGGDGADARSTVAPFLNTEREFLQSLGGLVQSHAEEIKSMVLALRGQAAAPSREDASPSDAAPGGASAEEIRRRLGEPSSPAAAAGSTDDGSAAGSAEDDVRRIPESATEPAFSSEGAPAGEGRERSLRELFWGED